MAFIEYGGKRHTVPAGEMLIGAGADCHLRVEGPGIALRHAVLVTAPDQSVAIRRLAAEVLVEVNGVALGPLPHPLTHGDKVTIGGLELLFVDERKSGSTQFVSADKLSEMVAAAQAKRAGTPGKATAATGGRLVSLTDGREYVILGASLKLGRDATNDVVVSGGQVSRRHAEIMVTPRGYVLVDSSTNGTFVNGERVQNQRLLARADIIRLGEEEFRFYADVAPQAAPAAPAPAAQPAQAYVPPAPPPAPHAAAQLTSTGYFETGAPRPVSAGSPRTGEEIPVLAEPVSSAAVAPPPPPAPAQPVAPAAQPPQAAAPPAAAPPRPSGAQPLAKFLVRSGMLKGQRLMVKVPIVNIGRADYNDIVVPDDSVSSQHAKLTRREGVWILTDLGSTNGTMVDGEKVEGDVPLAPGAYVRFGEVQLVFEPTDDSAGMQKGGATRAMSAVKLQDLKPPPGR